MGILFLKGTPYDPKPENNAEEHELIPILQQFQVHGVKILEISKFSQYNGLHAEGMRQNRTNIYYL